MIMFILLAGTIEYVTVEHALSARTLGSDLDSFNQPDTVLPHSKPTWLPSQNITNQPQIAVSGNNVFLVWSSTTATGNTEVLFARSTDYGTQFGPIINLSNDTGKATQPQIAVSGNNVYVVWSDTSGIHGRGDIFFAKSTNGGDTFDNSKNLSKDLGESNDPQIYAVGTVLYIVWKDTTQRDILFTTSADQGTDFAGSVNLSKTSSVAGVPAMAHADKQAYVAWQDIHGGRDYIYFQILHILKQENRLVLDNSSVPLVNYGSQIGLQRNPVTIEFFALQYYNNYKETGNQTAKQVFLNNSNWLLDHETSLGNYSVLDYHFAFPVPYPPSYVMKPPWHSGMTQGQALPVLVGAYQVTGEKKYIEAAKMILNSFFVEVKHGGVTYKTSNDGWWYEEYPIIGFEPRVLNGMMFALTGIYDYYNFTHDGDAKYLFDQGIHALIKSLPYYDNDKLSYYDIMKRSPGWLYHNAHLKLLSNLYNITKNMIFKKYYDKWHAFKGTLIPRNTPKAIERTAQKFYFL